MPTSTRTDHPPAPIHADVASTPRQTPLLPVQAPPAVVDGAQRVRAAAELPPAPSTPENRSDDRDARREAEIRRRALRSARRRDALEQAAREREQAFLRALATSGIPLR